MSARPRLAILRIYLTPPQLERIEKVSLAVGVAPERLARIALEEKLDGIERTLAARRLDGLAGEEDDALPEITQLVGRG